MGMAVLGVRWKMVSEEAVLLSSWAIWTPVAPVPWRMSVRDRWVEREEW